MNSIEFGKFIANLRNEKNLTQEELADKLFIDKKKVSRWECGTSIPEFDMLIKLSEIFDVSLYELSICKRINNDKLSRNIINKFKNIKDFRKYKIKRILLLVLIIVLSILFIKMSIYIYQNSGNLKIYKLESLDENINIVGTITSINDHNIIDVSELHFLKNIDIKNDDCDIDILNEGKRIFHILNIKEYLKSSNTNSIFLFDEAYNIMLNKNKLIFVINCKCGNKDDTLYSFDVKMNKKYDNSFL